MKEKCMNNLSRSEASTIFRMCTKMIHSKTISEISKNMISYANDAKKNKMLKNNYLKSAKK